MGEFFKLLKEGNKPSLLAAIVNTVIGILKGIAYFFTGNVAMFAEMMHSFGDAANQFFVFIGSALSRKAPTPRFPHGFGRVVNLVCLGAVIIVGILAYETIKEGYHHLLHPVQTDPSKIWINLVVLGIAIVLEVTVLYKAGKQVLHEAGLKGSGIQPVTVAFTKLNRAKPATKLVFMEDLVATMGGVLAFIAVLLANYANLLWAEGIASIIIGIMMFYVVGRVFLENARGAIGETDEEMLNHIAYLVAEDPNVQDIQKLEVIKEGEFLHVELVAEIDKTLTVEQADDIKDRLVSLILNQRSVMDITVSFEENDGIHTWKHIKERPATNDSLKKLDGTAKKAK